MKVEVITKTEVEIKEYWVIRAIKDTGKKKEVVAEYEINVEPDKQIIAQFLIGHPNADFCSVAHDYALVE